jgi:hypothetical protein
MGAFFIAQPLFDLNILSSGNLLKLLFEIVILKGTAGIHNLGLLKKRSSRLLRKSLIK